MLSPESSVSFVSLIFDKWQEKVSGKIYRVKCSDLTTDFIVMDEELLSRTKSGRKVVRVVWSVQPAFIMRMVKEEKQLPSTKHTGGLHGARL